MGTASSGLLYWLSAALERRYRKVWMRRPPNGGRCTAVWGARKGLDEAAPQRRQVHCSAGCEGRSG